MLNVIFVETALELVPKSITSHPSVKRNAKRRGKSPEETLLDRSLHHFAMGSLQNAERRGRPDIIHFCLLETLGSPLNKERGLSVWINTVKNYTIEINPQVRLPRDFYRFKSLMEQLFLEGKVPPKSEEHLLTLHEHNLQSLVKQIDPTITVALTSHGKLQSLKDLCSNLANESKPLVFIGAYPSGPMMPETLSEADEAISIYPESLEACIVTSRLIYEYEEQLALL